MAKTHRRLGGRFFPILFSVAMFAVGCSSEPGVLIQAEEASDESAATTAVSAETDLIERLRGTVWTIESIDSLSPFDWPASLSFHLVDERLQLSLVDNCGTAQVMFDVGAFTVAAVEGLDSLCYENWGSILSSGEEVELTVNEALLMSGGGHEVIARHFESVSQTGPVRFTDSAATSEIVEQYPILRLMSATDRPQVGSADFVMVDSNGVPVPTESVEHPTFLVKISAWHGVQQPIEFSIHMSYVEMEDSTITSRQCADRSGGFSVIGSGSHLFNRHRFPEIQGTSLEWDGEGCEVDESIDLAGFFDSEVLLEPDSTGFIASSQAGDEVKFLRIPAIDDSTQLATTNLVYEESAEPRTVIEPVVPPPETTTTIMENKPTS